jgi:hypothetical protein
MTLMFNDFQEVSVGNLEERIILIVLPNLTDGIRGTITPYTSKNLGRTAAIIDIPPRIPPIHDTRRNKETHSAR